jgi:phenylpropionate dioxygenase-like ring-hydroxylating dioxygenase large terminal subunit
MQRDNIIEILEELTQVIPPVSSAMTLPPRCYSDLAWLEREQQLVFRNSWVAVGRIERWQKTGDFVALEIAGVPTVVMKDKTGALHAYANSCRHRGMKLLQGEGQCKVVVCPFHGWTYDLEGALISAPRMETCEQLGTESLGLVEFRLDTRDGFVFVCMDPDQASLEEWLGDFSDVHAPWLLEKLVSTRVREFQVDCNWKSFIEVFNEYYHLPYVHPDSITGYYREPDPVDIVIGEYTTQFGVTDGTAALLGDSRQHALPTAPGLSGRNATGTRYTWIYPNLTFAACFDSLWMYQAYPLTVDRCHVVQTICFPQASLEVPNFKARAEAYYQRIDTALKEDLPFLEAQQQGLTSPFARQGRFSALEPSVGNFACWYADKLSAGGASVTSSL